MAHTAAAVAAASKVPDWNMNFQSETKLARHTSMLEKLGSDTYFSDTVERLASGSETVDAIAAWLAQGSSKSKGICAKFMNTFVRIRGSNATPGDAPLLAVYLTTPAPELRVRAVESKAHYNILLLGLWVSLNIDFWDKPGKPVDWESKMTEYHTIVHKKLVTDPKYAETISSLKEGTSLLDVANRLIGLEPQPGYRMHWPPKGACAYFIGSALQKAHGQDYPAIGTNRNRYSNPDVGHDEVGLSASDSKMIAEYMCIADASEVYARAKDARVFRIFDIALNAAWNMMEPMEVVHSSDDDSDESDEDSEILYRNR
jgi:hypothetical protein